MKVISTWVNPIFYLSIAVSLCLWEPGRAMSQSMGGKSAGCDLREYTEKTDPNSSPQDLAEWNQFTLSPAEIEAAARKITVRVTSSQNGGSGVLIASKTPSTTPKNALTPQGKITYLVLTNRHVVGKNLASGGFQIQTSDGKKHAATIVSNSSIDPKYDLALLQFTSSQQYDLSQIQDVSPIGEQQLICSIGFPFDSDRLRFSTGKISQLVDVPFQDGTQIGYEIDRGSQDLRQGMSGGPIMNRQGQVIGINTIGSQPILPNYIYFDGSKPPAQKVNKYLQANWGVPIYNFLTQLNADILYNYDNFPKVQRQVTPTGYMAKLNRETRQKTVRIETSGGNGSGVIIAKEGATYYVLTAKHVVEKKINIKVITHDRESYTIQPSNVTVAEGVDLAVVKFTTTSSNYPTAQIGEYIPRKDATVFLGGYPGRDRIDTPLWQWQLNPGKIYDREEGKFRTQDRESFSEGYDLLYTSITYGGMSGGPVLDTEGRVIGIHGKAEGDTSKRVILGSSGGISVQSFLGIASKLKVNPQLLSISKQTPANLNVTDLKTVEIVASNIAQPQENSSSQQWLQYGNQLDRIGKYVEAVAAFDKAIVKGEKLLGNYGKALALGHSGKQKEEALTAISIAIAAVPETEKRSYYYLWKYQSLILRDLSRYEEGLRAIEIAIKLEPSDFILINEKANFFAIFKKYPQAIAIYDEIIRQQPIAYFYYNRANAKFDSNRDLKSVLTDYNRAIELNPNYIKAYVNRGRTKSKLNNNLGAILDYNRAIQLNPNEALAYHNRGVSKNRIGNNREAILDYDRSIQLDPNYAMAYYNRGIAKFKSLDKQGAMLDFDRAIQLDPSDAAAYYNRGQAKSRSGNGREAILDYDRAIQINPNYAEAYYHRGIDRSDLKNYRDAILDYDRAIELNPNYAEAYSNRGVAKYILRYNRETILKDYDRAIQINPNYAEAYANRGSAKSKLGQNQEAIADLTRAADLLRKQGKIDLYQQVIGELQKLKE